MKNKTFIPLAILVLLLCIPIFFSVQCLHDREIDYPSGLVSNFDRIAYYRFDASTILEDIGSGKLNVFQKLDDESSISYEEHDVRFWNQENYMQIADAVHKSAFGEGVEGWKINSMDYFRACSDKPLGFSSGEIIFYQKSNGSNSYRTHLIAIHNGVAITGENNFQRPLLGWMSVQPNRFKVNADGALNIAEENGGRKFRTAFNNECQIILVLRPNPSKDNDWLVYYDYRGSLETFEILIDPYTGWY